MNNPQKRRKKSGFTLLEILLVLGVLSILTGLGLPLLVRRSQLRRAEETKVHLKQAFEALFGNPERPVPNLLAETGFQPPDGILKLKFLVNKDAIPGLRLPDPVADGQSVRIGTVNIKLAGLGG
jgi:prepilin-type N-terminal cleavage/methylation domain-containing protein